MKALATVLGALALTATSWVAPAAATPPPEVSGLAERLSEHVRILSDDSFQGRQSGTPAEALTLDYLQAQYETMGLEPGGPDGQWRQPVTLARFTPVPGPQLRAAMANGVTVNLTGAARAAYIRAAMGDGRAQFSNAPVVFAGYGLVAPELGWDDYGDVDVRGAVVIVMFGTPPDPRFNPDRPSYYQDGAFKADLAIQRGALAVLTVLPMRAGSDDWNGIAAYVQGTTTQAVAAHSLEAEGYLAMDPLVGWIRSNGGDSQAWFIEAAEGRFRARRLEGVTISADVQEQVETIQTYNLLARMPGTVRPDETIIVSAHWDHDGLADEPDEHGDAIYNGAWDNASGTAGVIELARMLHAQGPRRRSIVFAHMAAEEMGLLGSSYYVEHPVWPLETTVADINIDMLPLSPPTRDIQVFGYGQTTLEDDLARLAAEQGRVVTDDGRPEEGFYYRSDHFPFARAGVPALMTWHGVDWDEGGVDVGRPAAQAQWDRLYHQLDDEWSPDMDWRAAVENLDLLDRLVGELADSDAWPDWKPGSEFAPARARSQAMRH